MNGTFPFDLFPQLLRVLETMQLIASHEANLFQTVDRYRKVMYIVFKLYIELI